MKEEIVFRLYKLPEGKVKHIDYREESYNERIMKYGKDVISLEFEMEDGKKFIQIVGKTLLVHEPAKPEKSKKDKIKETILSYCQGNMHLEFVERDTDKMVQEIIQCFGEEE